MTGKTPLYSTTARVQQFSDGVFSIAITLLILEIKIPSAMDAPDLIKQLGGQWPSYLAYVLSFALIGIMWSNHHNIFRYIDRSNHNFVMLNVLLMLFIAVIPFPTAVMAEHLQKSEARTLATALYGATLSLTALVYYALWRYASKGGRLLHADADPVCVADITKGFFIKPFVYAAAAALAFLNVGVSIAAYALLAVLDVLPTRARP